MSDWRWLDESKCTHAHKDGEQPFEKFPELAKIIEWFANSVPLPGSVWSKLLREINKAIAAPEYKGDEKVIRMAFRAGRKVHYALHGRYAYVYNEDEYINSITPTPYKGNDWISKSKAVECLSKFYDSGVELGYSDSELLRIYYCIKRIKNLSQNKNEQYG